MRMLQWWPLLIRRREEQSPALGELEEKLVAKTNRLGALAAAVGMLAAVGLLVLMLVVIEAGPAEATFPGKNGKIAYGTSSAKSPYLYNLLGRGGKTKVREGQLPSFSPDGRKIAYVIEERTDVDIFTIQPTRGAARPRHEALARLSGAGPGSAQEQGSLLPAEHGRGDAECGDSARCYYGEVAG
jgi:hypothetical protein